MKTILTIGHTKWVCPDATVPAKIADLLGGLKTVEQAYPDNGVGKPVLVPSKDWRHELKIEELPDGMLLTAAEFKKWKLETCKAPHEKGQPWV